MTGTMLLLAGPAGAGKSTLAASWCGTREIAAHVQLDQVRELLVQGQVDPRDVDDPKQARQWRLSVTASCALARSFADADADADVDVDVDVAVDDVLLPEDADSMWLPLMTGLPVRLVVILPALEQCLIRGGHRGKRVPEHLVRAQHEGSSRWPRSRQLDTTDQTPAESLSELLALMTSPDTAWP